MRRMSVQVAADLGSALAKATSNLASQLPTIPTGQTTPTAQSSAAATGVQNPPQVLAPC